MDTAGPDMTGQTARSVRRHSSPFHRPIAPAHHVGHGLHVRFEVRPRLMASAVFFANAMTKAGATWLRPVMSFGSFREDDRASISVRFIGTEVRSDRGRSFG